MPQAHVKTLYQLEDGKVPGGNLPRWLDLPEKVCRRLDAEKEPFVHEWTWRKGHTNYCMDVYDPYKLTQKNPDSGRVRQIRKVFLTVDEPMP